MSPNPCVATIGTFDGVHRGHQWLLRRVIAEARARDLDAVAITFEPSPLKILRPDVYLGRINDHRIQEQQLLAIGIDRVEWVPFTAEVAATPPEQFMAELVAKTNLRHLIVGEDFALGRGRAGDVDRLREIGAELGFTIEALPRQNLGDEHISSTAIRQAILDGDVAKARRLLGRPFRIEGEVVHGKKLGRTIGFPTANVMPPEGMVPLADGIYAAWAWLPGDTDPRPAITYVGKRPTVNTGDRVVETHLLDFEGDIYGQHLKVDLLEHLRPDAQFPSLEALIDQMKIDRQNAAAVHARERAG